MNGDWLGAHVGTSGGLHTAPARAAGLPARVFQIFTTNQNQWRGRVLSEQDLVRWRQELLAHRLRAEDACSHASYLVNLASSRGNVLHLSLRALGEEIRRCAALGIRNLVLHPGSHLGAGEAAGVAAVAAGLDRCLEETAEVPGAGRVMVCLEGTAGQGTNLGHRFEHLRDIVAASRHPERLAVCLDTCHLFAAGYALDSAEAWQQTLGEFDRIVGLERLRVLHVNDSAREAGSRIDRHARIGDGAIGAEALATVILAPQLEGRPLILEVPGKEEAYAEDLALLRRLTGQQGPAGEGSQGA